MNNELKNLDHLPTYQEIKTEYKEQLKRFYDEVKRKGVKHVEGFKPLIEADQIKPPKGLDKKEFLQALNEALIKYKHAQADKSAKRNRQLNR